MRKITASNGKPVSLGAVMLGGAYTTQRERNQDDYYPTPHIATEALLRKWTPEGNIWEPCAGSGDITDVVKKHKPDDFVYQTDINPRRDDILKQDFLKTTEPPENIDTIITNPPFKLAEAFIRHGFEIGIKRQAVLLKSTFFHAKSRIDLFYDIRPKLLLPMTFRVDFMGLGRPTMDTMWVIWDDIANTKHTEYDLLPRPLTKEEIEKQERSRQRKHKREQRRLLKQAGLAL